MKKSQVKQIIKEEVARAKSNLMTENMISDFLALLLQPKVNKEIAKYKSTPEYKELEREIEQAKKKMERAAAKLNKVANEKEKMAKDAKKLGIDIKSDFTYYDIVDAFEGHQKALEDKLKKYKK